MPLPDLTDQLALTYAFEALENADYLVELATLIGKPIEIFVGMLPRSAATAIEKATSAALNAALKVAISSMKLDLPASASSWIQKAAVTVSGGVGGAFGLPALAIELPLSTTIILRSIADIAKAEGEDLSQVESRLACIEVFAVGGRRASDDAAESGYFAVRAALGKAVSEAATYIAQRGAAEEAAPVMVRLASKIAQRFAPAVADKLAAQAAPVIGAVGGAVVNLVFISHFQRIARGHFTIRRLERKYGEDRVRQEFESLRPARP
jgi:hypothetical protein